MLQYTIMIQARDSTSISNSNLRTKQLSRVTRTVMRRFLKVMVQIDEFDISCSVAASLYVIQ